MQVFTYLDAENLFQPLKLVIFVTGIKLKKKNVQMIFIQ